VLNLRLEGGGKKRGSPRGGRNTGRAAGGRGKAHVEVGGREPTIYDGKDAKEKRGLRRKGRVARREGITKELPVRKEKKARSINTADQTRLYPQVPPESITKKRKKCPHR